MPESTWRHGVVWSCSALVLFCLWLAHGLDSHSLSFSLGCNFIKACIIVNRKLAYNRFAQWTPFLSNCSSTRKNPFFEIWWETKFWFPHLFTCWQTVSGTHLFQSCDLYRHHLKRVKSLWIGSLHGHLDTLRSLKVVIFSAFWHITVVQQVFLNNIFPLVGHWFQWVHLKI